MRAVLFACALVLGTTPVAHAQDPADVDAKHYKVLIDNERTRVFHVLVGPGEQVPRHEHTDAIMIPLTVPTTGERSRARAAVFIPAQKHGGDNPGTNSRGLIYVELKGDTAPTAMVPSNRPGIKSTRLLEHAKADAIRATADTGFSEPARTTHDYDQVIVAIK